MACNLTVTNRTPPEWQLTMVSGGCVFSFKTGEKYNDGPRGIGAATGEAATFSCPNPGCVNEIMLAIEFNAPQENQPITKTVTLTPKNGIQCLPTDMHIAVAKVNLPAAIDDGDYAIRVEFSGNGDISITHKS